MSRLEVALESPQREQVPATLSETEAGYPSTRLCCVDNPTLSVLLSDIAPMSFVAQGGSRSAAYEYWQPGNLAAMIRVLSVNDIHVQYV